MEDRELQDLSIKLRQCVSESINTLDTTEIIASVAELLVALIDSLNCNSSMKKEIAIHLIHQMMKSIDQNDQLEKNKCLN